MIKTLRIFAVSLILGLTGIVATADAQDGTYRITDRDGKDIADRIDRRAERFQVSLKDALLKAHIYKDEKHDIFQEVKDFYAAAEVLRDSYVNHHPDMAPAEQLLRQGADIDKFMREHPLYSRAEEDWAHLRKDLGELAQASNLTTEWNPGS